MEGPVLRCHPDEPCPHRKEREDDQGGPHTRGGLAKMTNVLGISPKAAAEGEKIEAKNIEGGEKSRGESKQPDKVAPSIEGGEKDLTLRPEACQGEDPGAGQGPNQEGIRRHAHMRCQASH